MNALTYKEVFPLFKDNKVWYGVSITSGDRKFYVPDDYPLNASGCGVDDNGRRFIRVKGVRWFTNLDNNKRHEVLDLIEHYSPDKYPTYDNYDAINVDKTADIPMDYYEAMGVPITFMDKFNPEQFEIVGADFDLAEPIKLDNGKTGTGRFYVTRERERAFILSNSDTQEEIKNILINDVGVSENQIEYRNGIIGVPISFMDKYCPDQFEIVGLDRYVENNPHYGHRFTINKKETYARILIKNRRR